MSSGVNGVDNSGAECGLVKMTVVNNEGTMQFEGPPGEEALKEFTNKNGDKKRYWGSRGAERFNRIDRADGRVETYKGPRHGEFLTEAFVPGVKTVLYGGAKEAMHKVLEIDHFSRRVDIYKRDGEEAATSSWLRKVDGGKFYARKGVEDEWEEVEVNEEWLEKQSELRKRQKRAREDAERAEQERKRRMEQQAKEAAESEKRRRFAEAQFNGPTLAVGSVSGADRAVIGEDYCDTGDSKALYAPNTA